MSKTKISPWPWKIYPTHNKIEIQDANAQQVAVVWSGEMRHGGHSKSRYMNARLLALAPKLLEECGNALRVLRRINNPDVGCTCHTDGHYCAACTTRDLETIVACASEVPDVFTVDPWCHKETHDERAIDPAQGHTLTPAAKPEAKPTPPAVKENLTTDVPASSVHLRTDAHLSAVICRVNGLADWLTALESRLAAATDEIGHWIKRVETEMKLGETRLGTRLAAVTESAADARQIADNVSDRVDELAERVKALEKPTTTGVVKVPAPVSHQGLFTDGELRVIDARDSAWRVALTAAGVKWEESK